MAKLIKVATSNVHSVHVIFVHGLGGHPYSTWKSKKEVNSFWPLWLVDDINAITAWTISYEASSSNWFGHSISIEDRALNILECLLTEPELKKGKVIFICHSLGGLLIKQLLRQANDLKDSRSEVAKLISQVKGIIFIATPHAGSIHANIMDKFRFFLRPSIATKNLFKNNSNLRSLNTWYRNWSSSISHLVFTETKSTSGGTIVDSGSCDPGLEKVVPIPIDKDHIQITKPTGKDSLIYKLIKAFVDGLVPQNQRNKTSHTVTKFNLPTINSKISLSLLLRILFIVLMISLATKLWINFIKQPIPRVAVMVKDNLPWLSQCAEFTFSNLPNNFGIQYIKMHVLEIVGPTKIVANQSAKVDEFCVHKKFKRNELYSLNYFDVDVKRYSTKEQDLWITPLCLSIEEKGFEAKMTLSPTFYGLDGSELFLNQVQPFDIYFSHPKSALKILCNE